MNLMKKFSLLILSIGILIPFTLRAQNTSESKGYIKVPIAFYNVENLFDTEKGSNNDSEFLPDGINAWTPKRYKKKLHNMARVISQIGGGPAVIGLAEVENRGVLEDLASEPALKHLGYEIVHYDSPDARGVDCAFFYRPDILAKTSSAAHKLVIEGSPNFRTRDIVQLSGTIEGELIHFLVGHWPSRSGGEAATIHLRMAAAKLMRHVADSLRAENPESQVIMMGDFNDDPTSPSVVKGIGAKSNPFELTNDDYYCPMTKLFKAGKGTLAYRDVWNLFDIIVVSGGLVRDDYKSFNLYQDPKTNDHAFIFRKPFMMQKSGRYKNYPLRTIVGGQYQGGYSDHFPVYIYLVKEVQ